MGWTYQKATHYKNDKIDKRAECDSLFAKPYKVLHSSLLGNVYYAAIEDATSKNVFAVVVLIKINNKDFYYNFGYKIINESMEPYYYDCPKKILNLLSPTTDEFALIWRRKCNWKRIEKNKHRKYSL